MRFLGGVRLSPLPPEFRNKPLVFDGFFVYAVYKLDCGRNTSHPSFDRLRERFPQPPPYLVGLTTSPTLR